MRRKDERESECVSPASVLTDGHMDMDMDMEGGFGAAQQWGSPESETRYIRLVAFLGQSHWTVIVRDKCSFCDTRCAARFAAYLISKTAQRRGYSIIVGTHSVHDRECVWHLSV